MRYLRANVLWIFLVLLFFPTYAFAQEATTTTKLSPSSGQRSHTISLNEALNILSKKYEVFFTFLKEVVEPYQVEIDLLSIPGLEQSLQLILSKTSLRFKKVSPLNYLIFDHRTTTTAYPDSSTSKLNAKKLDKLPSYETQIGPSPPSKKQAFTLKGSVLNEHGEPLIGVNIRVRQTTFSGTTTDREGNFHLTLEHGEQTLICSYIGYQLLEIPVKQRTHLHITLKEQVAVLSEVIVVGYGNQHKRDVIGAISTVKADELEKVSSGSLDQRLQGWASGVMVQNASGIAGAPVRVLVRGTNSLFSGTEPLWIIDGMILSPQGGAELRGFSRNSATTTPLNPMVLLNPNDIASIEILKDAAATAIYGSRGANGVIIVTTKSGNANDGALKLKVSYGISEPVRGPEDLGFVDGSTWIELMDKARFNSGLTPFDPNSLLDNSRDPQAVLERTDLVNTNWFNQILRQGAVQEFNLSGNQRSEEWELYWSSNYRNEHSVLRSDALRRFSLRTNMKYALSPSFSIDSRINLSYTQRKRAPNGGSPGGNTNMATGGYNMANTESLPIFPIFHPTARNANSEPVLFDPLSGRNPVASFNRDNYINDVNTYRALAGLQFQWSPSFISGLSLHSEWAIDLIQTSNIEWGNTVIRENSAYAFDFSSTFHRFNYNVYANLNRNLGTNHHLKWVIGSESTQQASRARNVEAQELFGSAKEIGNPGDILRLYTGRGNERYFRGYFSRLNYKFLDRYLFGISFRRDGSSIFQEKQRWGNFIAFSAGWVLSNEPFFPKIDAINYVKLKGSFGQTGNSAINTLATETTYTGWGRYGEVGSGDLLTGIGNKGITWETTDSWDIGLEFSLFDDKVNLSTGYYFQNTSDMLYQVPVPVSTGIFSSAPTIWQNIGDLRNQGWEFEINAMQAITKDFHWQMGFNFSSNTNKITHLTGEAEEIYAPRKNGLVTKVGERIGFFRLAHYAGIHPEGGYELIEEIDLERLAATGERIATGRLIPATRENLSIHLFDHTSKSGLPTWFGGFSNTLTYKNWQFFALFNFSGGNYIFDNAEQNASYVNGAHQIRQQVIDNYWTPERTNAHLPALSWDQRYDVLLEDGSILEDERFDRRNIGHAHDKYLYSGDFLRLRSLSLNYTLPKSLSNRLRMDKVRLGLSANNLLTFTKYPGIDPEFVALGNNRNIGQGWNGVQLPQVRSFFLHLELGF